MQEERAHSEEQASLVNQAYSVLKDPLKRAFYLVRRLGLLVLHLHLIQYHSGLSLPSAAPPRVTPERSPQSNERDMHQLCFCKTTPSAEKLSVGVRLQSARP